MQVLSDSVEGVNLEVRGLAEKITQFKPVFVRVLICTSSYLILGGLWALSFLARYFH